MKINYEAIMGEHNVKINQPQNHPQRDSQQTQFRSGNQEMMLTST